MSAICGIFNLDGKPVLREEIAAMMKPMAYWGPDDSGIWVDGPVGLGHLMLHTTPESLHEKLPLVSADGNLVLTADARIDNRDDLSTHVRMDSDLILLAYSRHHSECAHRLIGDYAFAIWNHRLRELFLARDHEGTRPLFYRARPTSFAFASTLRALFARHDQPEVNDQRVADYLADLNAIGESTFYKGYLRLPPAHSMIVSQRGTTVDQYWRLESIPDLRLRSDNAYVEAARDIFGMAVNARLRNPRIGLALSGGLDSTAIVTLASSQLRKHDRKIHAFTLVPRAEWSAIAQTGQLANERPFVELLEPRLTNVEVQYLDAGHRNPLTALDEEFQLLDRPHRGMRNRPWTLTLLDAAHSLGIGSLLTGQQGNGTLSWSGRGYFAALARSGRWRTLVRQAQDWATYRERSLVKTLLVEALLPNLPIIRPTGLRSYLGNWSLISRPFAREMAVEARFRSNDIYPFRSSMDTRRNRYRLIKPAKHERGDILAALGSARHLEFLDPMADRRLMEFCIAIPDEQYIYAGEDRALVRRMMKGLLPNSILQNRRRGEQGSDTLFSMIGIWPAIHRSIREFENSAASRYLDIKRMKELAFRLENSSGRSAGIGEIPFLRAYALGSFILWLKQRRYHE